MEALSSCSIYSQFVTPLFPPCCSVLQDISSHFTPVCHARLTRGIWNSSNKFLRPQITKPTVIHFPETMATPGVVGSRLSHPEPSLSTDRPTYSHVLYKPSPTLRYTYAICSCHASDQLNISHYKLIEHGGSNDNGSIFQSSLQPAV